MKQPFLQKLWYTYIWNSHKNSGANTRATFSKETEWFLNALKGGTFAGATVNAKTVTGLSPSYRCINILSQMPAKLPLHPYQKTDAGKKQLDNDNRAYLLHTMPNEFQTPFQLISIAEMYRQTKGNGLIGINRDRLGNPISLELLPTPHVEIKVKDSKVYYRQKETFLEERVDKVWEHKDVINVPNFSVNGIKGLSTVEHHRSTFGLAIASQESASKLYERGLNFNGYLEVPPEYGEVGDDAKKNLESSWSDKYAGVKGHHSTPILEGGVKFHPISMKLKDAQFLETRKYSGLQQCQIWGVPPQKIYDLDDAHYNNVDSLNIEWYLDTILGQLTAWEQELNRKLFFPNERQNFWKFNVKGLLRGDIIKQAEFYTKMVNSGIYNRDEVRKLEDMNNIPGGDIHTVQMQMMELQNAINNGNKEAEEQSIDRIIDAISKETLKIRSNGHYKEN